MELAKECGMPIFADITGLRLGREIYQKVPYHFVKKHRVLPIDEEADKILVAVCNPLALEPLEDLSYMLNQSVKPVFTPQETLEAAIHDCYNRETGGSELFAEIEGKSHEEEVEVYDLLDDATTIAPVIRMLNLIIREAIQQGASDIHFEPHETGLKVRYRIDGVLQNRHAPPLEYQPQIVARIKVMAKLDIAEHRLPQDGRIKLRMGRREVDFRVSTVPVAGGERIVLRILDKGNIVLGLEEMGMPKQLLEQFRQLINLPEGIILVTGPTGSGKTTTLYSAICEILNEETNIMTIEDPIEYRLRGIAQIGVKPKINLTFAAGLRTILRQDPDVIMVGEIRDKETADIAIQASLTGHLVFSTLHTNDAPSAVTRLVDMGIEPYLLSSTVVGVLAQRLVRRICPSCKESYTPTEKEIQSVALPKVDQLYRGKGCQECFETGFRGRHGLYELMLIDPSIRRQIAVSPDAVDLRQLALKQGMLTLLRHGSQLVQEGVTTVSEVLRATRAAQEEE
ncbi:MAG: type II secretion system ATPase GspE [Chlamydiia bacterium]|nr:type II secretion system ATPase GspE [Chlamydiia bacterium]